MHDLFPSAIGLLPFDLKVSFVGMPDLPTVSRVRAHNVANDTLPILRSAGLLRLL